MWKFLFGEREEKPVPEKHRTVGIIPVDFDMVDGKAKRKLTAHYVLKCDDSYNSRSVEFSIHPDMRDTNVLDLMKTGKVYLLYVIPWVEGLLTAEELAATGKVEFVPMKPDKPNLNEGSLVL